MTIRISDHADEFLIAIAGSFSGSGVAEASQAWKTALDENIPRRISVDITHMTGYDHGGYLLLCKIQAHGTHIVAGTPRSLLFLSQISGGEFASWPARRGTKSPVVAMPFRAAASGE